MQYFKMFISCLAIVLMIGCTHEAWQAESNGYDRNRLCEKLERKVKRYNTFSQHDTSVDPEFQKIYDEYTLHGCDK